MNESESLRERQEYLFLVTDNLIYQRELWSNDTTIQGLPSGGSLWMAAEQVVDAFETGTIPGSCRKLCRAVEEFTRHWKAHTSRAEVSPTDDLLPGDNVWAAIRSIEAARKGAAPQTAKLLEPVAELVKQRVTDEQIAKIYNWKNQLGHWDLEKVRAAKREPGKYDGEAYYQEQERLKAEKSLRDKQLAESMAKRISNKGYAAPAEGPESIEMLIAQGLSVTQISRVKVMTVQEVMQYCQQHGISLHGPTDQTETVGSDLDVYDDPEQETVTYEMDDEAGDYQHDQLGMPAHHELSIEQQILQLADSMPEAKPDELAATLGCSADKVTTVLARRSEIEQAI